MGVPARTRTWSCTAPLPFGCPGVSQPVALEGVTQLFHEGADVVGLPAQVGQRLTGVEVDAVLGEGEHSQPVALPDAVEVSDPDRGPGGAAPPPMREAALFGVKGENSAVVRLTG